LLPTLAYYTIYLGKTQVKLGITQIYIFCFVVYRIDIFSYHSNEEKRIDVQNIVHYNKDKDGDYVL